ncbi:hypothetical protein C8Q74DRAFT_1220320 [Fomes fomentarius]|nr:hypothetical protein C8Q74DRAFT_1220320 [Fomes fomentarius]
MTRMTHTTALVFNSYSVGQAESRRQPLPPLTANCTPYNLSLTVAGPFKGVTCTVCKVVPSDSEKGVFATISRVAVNSLSGGSCGTVLYQSVKGQFILHNSCIRTHDLSQEPMAVRTSGHCLTRSVTKVAYSPFRVALALATLWQPLVAISSYYLKGFQAFCTAGECTAAAILPKLPIGNLCVRCSQECDVNGTGGIIHLYDFHTFVVLRILKIGVLQDQHVSVILLEGHMPSSRTTTRYRFSKKHSADCLGETRIKGIAASFGIVWRRIKMLYEHADGRLRLKYAVIGLRIVPVKDLVCNQDFLALPIIFCGAALRKDLVLGRPNTPARTSGAVTGRQENGPAHAELHGRVGSFIRHTRGGQEFKSSSGDLQSPLPHLSSTQAYLDLVGGVMFCVTGSYQHGGCTVAQ